MSDHDFDQEFKQHQIKMAKRERALAEIRENIITRMVAHKKDYPSFAIDHFLKWWDGLTEWEKRMHRHSNAASLNRIRRRDEKLRKLAEKE